MKKFLIGTVKVFITAMLALILWMPGYFIVRSFFPLDRLEFGGLSFWGLMKQRGERFDEIAYTYELTTGQEPKYGMCINVEVGAAILKIAPESMACGVMNIRENWRSTFDNRPDLQMLGCGVTEANWITAPKVGWEIFEKYLSVILDGTKGAIVRYCQQGLNESVR